MVAKFIGGIFTLIVIFLVIIGVVKMLTKILAIARCPNLLHCQHGFG